MSRIQISTLLACVLPACLFAQTSIRPSSAAGSYSYPSSRASGGGGSSSASGGSSGGGSSTRQYRNNTMLGDALIQIDPESRSLIIVADDETEAEVLKVIKNLDRPKPQVLIKVLFAQVTLDKSLDLGVERAHVGHEPHDDRPELGDIEHVGRLYDDQYNHQHNQLHAASHDEQPD